MKFRCSAILFFAATTISSCATQSAQWAAHGYLTPGPTSEPEIIGVFDALSECNAAAEAWTTRQVVGNPVFAECYQVDRK